MHRIWKYLCPIHGSEPFTIRIPIEHNMLCVQLQDGIPCLWAHVNTDKPDHTTKFRWFATGSEVPIEGTHSYVGTVQLLNGEVYHLFRFY